MFFYGSILSEFLRITKFTIKLSDFVLKVKQLYLRMMNQIKKAIKQHPITFNSFSV